MKNIIILLTVFLIVGTIFSTAIYYDNILSEPKILYEGQITNVQYLCGSISSQKTIITFNDGHTEILHSHVNIPNQINKWKLIVQEKRRHKHNNIYTWKMIE